MSEDLLRSAVKKLGPIAAANALTAFADPYRGWRQCGLARAYGADGELLTRMCDLAERFPHEDNFELAARVLSIQQDEALAFVMAFDSPGARRDALRDLLAAEASKLDTPSPRDGLRASEAERASQVLVASCVGEGVDR